MRGNWDEAAPAPPQQLEADTILRALLEHGVEFVVIGGFAVAAHGFPRATKDVDVAPRPAPENRRRLVAALAALGAESLKFGDALTGELPVSFGPEGLEEGGNWALRTAAGRVDVLQWMPGIAGYDSLRAHATEVDVPRVGRVAFAGYEDVVAMKLAAGRAQDTRDLDELRAIRGES